MGIFLGIVLARCTSLWVLGCVENDALVNGCVENDALVFIRVAMVYYRAAKVMLADYDYLLQHELFILQE